jgi:hypothetical protein
MTSKEIREQIKQLKAELKRVRIMELEQKVKDHQDKLAKRSCTVERFKQLGACVSYSRGE